MHWIYGDIRFFSSQTLQLPRPVALDGQKIPGVDMAVKTIIDNNTVKLDITDSTMLQMDERLLYASGVLIKSPQKKIVTFCKPAEANLACVNDQNKLG